MIQTLERIETAEQEQARMVAETLNSSHVKRCDAHKIYHNSALPCPLCAQGSRVEEKLAPEPRVVKKGTGKCRICGGGTRGTPVCTKYQCQLKAYPPQYLRCPCGTKIIKGEIKLCAKYECWKKAGRADEWRHKYVKR